MKMGFNIDTKGWEAKKSRIIQGLPRVVENIVKQLAYTAERKMADEAPEKSTRMRSSIKTTFRDGGRSATVEPHTNYAKFVIIKTRPSPGRYVPAIGKRLVNPPRGMHPGTKADDFVGRAREHLKGEVDGVIKRAVNAFLAEVR